MYPSRIGVLTLLVVFAAVLATCRAESGKASDSDDANLTVTSTTRTDVDDIVELNPNYGDPDDADEYDDEYDYETDYDGDDEATGGAGVKRRLANALGKSKGISPRRTLKAIKKNRVKITVALAIFAFRNELGQLLLRLCTVPHKIDPETGKVLSRTVNISPTSALKILLFVDFMRRMQKGSDSGTMFPMGPKGVLLAPLLSRLMHPMQSSVYVPPIDQHWTFERVNERYTRDALAFHKAMKPSNEAVQDFSTRSQAPESKTRSSEDLVILLDWTKLTQSVTQMPLLRDQVSFLLSQQRPSESNTTQETSVTKSNNTRIPDATDTTGAQIEVVVLLESPGGSAADYGLAAQQILRLRNAPGITLTVCVDKVAASGGYMVACCSSPGRLYAAPFAVLGSIGVIGSSINIQRVLLGWGVRPLVFRGGKDKAPVGLIGEITRDGVAKVQSMVDSTHDAFKLHVATARPVLAQNINKIATGDTWLGCDALDAGLVDRIVSSDEYVGERLRDGARVLRLLRYERSRILFPPLPSSRTLGATWRTANQSFKALFVDLPRAMSKLSTLLQDEASVTCDPGLSASTLSFAATAVQAQSSL